MHEARIKVGVCSLSLRRSPTTICVRESHVEKLGDVQDVSYEILNVLEFNRSAMFLNTLVIHGCLSYALIAIFVA